MKHVEIEFKNLLTKKEYDVLKDTYKKQLSSPFTQTNTYFDQNGQLKTHDCALRTRIFKGKNEGELTLKIRQSPIELIEITEHISTKQLVEWNQQKGFILPTNIQTALQQIGLTLSSVNYLTSVTTIRQEAELTPGVAIMLDHSFFAQTEDYELEVEVLDAKKGEQYFQSLLNQHKIPTRNTLSKIARALMYEDKR